jgi:ketosteroid isomerase-like protein
VAGSATRRARDGAPLARLTRLRHNGRITAILLMRKSKLQAANLEGDADDIEAAFYDALQRGDIDKLMACWADEDDIVCIHPGGPRVVGATAIRATFESMFSDGGTVRAWPERVRKTVAVGSSVHNVLERVEVLTASGPTVAWVIATNVYHRTAQGWRLVAHHSSPGTTSEIQEVSDAPSVLH